MINGRSIDAVIHAQVSASVAAEPNADGSVDIELSTVAWPSCADFGCGNRHQQTSADVNFAKKVSLRHSQET